MVFLLACCCDHKPSITGHVAFWLAPLPIGTNICGSYLCQWLWLAPLTSTIVCSTPDRHCQEADGAIIVKAKGLDWYIVTLVKRTHPQQNRDHFISLVHIGFERVNAQKVKSESRCFTRTQKQPECEKKSRSCSVGNLWRHQLLLTPFPLKTPNPAIRWLKVYQWELTLPAMETRYSLHSLSQLINTHTA